MSITLSDFRAEFPEFAGTSDARIESLIAYAESRIDETRWSNQYDMGLLLHTAHHVAMLNSAGPKAGPGPVAVKTMGGLSVSFAAYLASAGGQSHLKATAYGRMLLDLSQSIGLRVDIARMVTGVRVNVPEN